LAARQRRDVELHRDVGAEQALDPHGLLGAEVATGAVEVRPEHEAVLGRGAPLGERERLEAARVGEHRVGPSREAVEAPVGRDDLGAGAEPQVVGVPEHDAGARRGHVVRGERLDRALRADGHERRRLHDAVGRREHRGAGLATPRLDLEAVARRRRPHDAASAALTRDESSMASPYE
jgi:hypothetical protein